MTTPAPLQFTSYFAKAQSALGSPATLTNADAITIVSADITESGTRVIKRADVATGLGGQAIPLQSDRYFDIKIMAQLSSPDTVGNSSTWNLLPLFQSSPISITDVALTSTTLTRTIGSVPMTDWTPITFAGATKNGLTRKATDVMLALTSAKADAGGVIMLEFVGVGQWTADAATTLTAPAPAHTKLPIVCMNGTMGDDVLGSGEFGLSLSTGMKITPLKSDLATYGWGTPIGTCDGAELVYDVLAATDYQTEVAAGTKLTTYFTFGGFTLTTDDAYILTVDSVDQGGAQAYTITMALSPTPTTPEWEIILT